MVVLRSIAKQVIPGSLVRLVRERISRRAFDISCLRSKFPSSVFRDLAIDAAFADDVRRLPTVDLPGGVNTGDRRAIYHLTMGLAVRVLEVGTHIGASTSYVARALKRKAGHLVTVDIVDVNADNGPWRRLGAQRPRALMQAIDCRDTVTFVHAPAQQFMATCREKFDLIFLDGDHARDAVYNEVALATRLLNPEGVILLHDYYPDCKPLFPNSRVISGPFEAMARAARENPDLTVYPIGSLPWPTKQGTSASSLAAMLRQSPKQVLFA